MFFEAFRRVYSIKERHRGKKYTPGSFTKLLRSQFRDPQLRFTTHRDKFAKSGDILIGGEYHPLDDEDGETCVFLNFYYDNSNSKIDIDRVDWYKMAFYIADSITHEYLHQYYIRKRNFRMGRGYRTHNMRNYADSWQDYLGCEDEILAFGFSAAAESVAFGKTIEKTKVYKRYERCFRHDPKVLTKLKKQAVKYLKALEADNDKSRERRARNSTRCL